MNLESISRDDLVGIFQHYSQLKMREKFAIIHAQSDAPIALRSNVLRVRLVYFQPGDFITQRRNVMRLARCCGEISGFIVDYSALMASSLPHPKPVAEPVPSN